MKTDKTLKPIGLFLQKQKKSGEKMSKTLKAYNVQSGESGIIIFHFTKGKAKFFALHHDENFECDEYLDLTATREPKADEFCKSAEPHVLEFCENAKIYCALNWECHSWADCEKENCPLKIEALKEYQETF